jgi:small basic protein
MADILDRIFSSISFGEAFACALIVCGALAYKGAWLGLAIFVAVYTAIFVGVIALRAMVEPKQ